MDDKMAQYKINAIAGFVELSLGLPLDRIKIGIQSGFTFREIIRQSVQLNTPSRKLNIPNTYNSKAAPNLQEFNNILAHKNNYIAKDTRHMPSNSSGTSGPSHSKAHPEGCVYNRVATVKLEYIKHSVRYWFAGHIPSVLNRCCIYLPGIAFFNSNYTEEVEPVVNKIYKCPVYISQTIIKPLAVSLIISPYVAFFEGLKTAQQLGYKTVYPHIIITIDHNPNYHNPNYHNLNCNYNSRISKLNINILSNTSVQLIRGVINSGNVSSLFAGFLPTFARETAFISGMCVVQPLIATYCASLCDKSSAYDDIQTSEHNKPYPIINKVFYNSETIRITSSLIASFMCQTISQPFDVLKTRRESNPMATWTQTFDKIHVDIVKIGYRNILFSGWLPRCIRGIWTFYSISAIRDIYTVQIAK